MTEDEFINLLNELIHEASINNEYDNRENLTIAKLKVIDAWREQKNRKIIF